ncbi:MAG: hypothetical protein U9Q30_05455 [Campylobacterota bacterium]|nr:hypothetical protein [Campylobacterota bacterium]
MSNELVEVNNEMIWKSYNGAVVEKKDQMNIVPLSNYFKALNINETKKIVNAFELGMYDMGLEYAWSRAMKVLDNRLENFGLDFIAEMTDRESLSTLEQLSNTEKIELAFELGMINTTAKMLLVQANETLNHFISRDIAGNDEEIEPIKALGIVLDITKYILGNEIETSSIEFKDFRDKLKETIYQYSDNQINILKNSPYFYIKTTIRTILSLIKSAYKENNISELSKVLNNANIFIVSLWEQIFIEDKKLIGTTYAQAISDGHKETVKTFSTILDAVQGYDFVPETTRSNTYKKIAREFSIVHFGMNNFYNEPIYAKKLNSMGTVIPDFALQECLKAVIISIIGNQYGRSDNAQEYNFKILDKVTTEQWKQFFSKLIIQDQTILERLTYSTSSMLENWFKIINQYITDDFNIKNTIAKNIFTYSKNNNAEQLKKETAKTLVKIVGK